MRILVAGWRARSALDRHADETNDIFDGGACRECHRFVVALLNNVPREQALEMRCDKVRGWSREIQAAQRIVDEWEIDGADPRDEPYTTKDEED